MFQQESGKRLQMLWNQISCKFTQVNSLQMMYLVNQSMSMKTAKSLSKDPRTESQFGHISQDWLIHFKIILLVNQSQKKKLQLESGKCFQMLWNQKSLKFNLVISLQIMTLVNQSRDLKTKSQEFGHIFLGWLNHLQIILLLVNQSIVLKAESQVGHIFQGWLINRQIIFIDNHNREL